MGGVPRARRRAAQMVAAVAVAVRVAALRARRSDQMALQGLVAPVAVAAAAGSLAVVAGDPAATRPLVARTMPRVMSAVTPPVGFGVPVTTTVASPRPWNGR